jgi:hypothetical protein
MNSNENSAASAGSTSPIQFLDFEKSTALGSFFSISSNILLMKVAVKFVEEESHREVYQ